MLLGSRPTAGTGTPAGRRPRPSRRRAAAPRPRCIRPPPARPRAPSRARSRPGRHRPARRRCRRRRRGGAGTAERLPQPADVVGVGEAGGALAHPVQHLRVGGAVAEPGARRHAGPHVAQQGARVRAGGKAAQQPGGEAVGVAVVLDPVDAAGHGEDVEHRGAVVAGARQLGDVVGHRVGQRQGTLADRPTDQVGQHRLGHRGAQEQRVGAQPLGVPLMDDGALLEHQQRRRGRLLHPLVEPARPAGATTSTDEVARVRRQPRPWRAGTTGHGSTPGRAGGR